MALDLDDGDWIPVWRKIRKSWLWQDPEALRAWIDLIMLANHHDGSFRFRVALHPMKRGQVATTFLSLAKRNGWSRDRVKSFLRMLEQANSITITHRTFDTTTNAWSDTKSDNGFILLTIVNYPLRKAGQNLPTAESAAESAGIRQGNTGENRQRSDSASTAVRQRSDTSKKGKKGKNEKKGGEEGHEPAPSDAPRTPPSVTEQVGLGSAGNQPEPASPPTATLPDQRPEATGEATDEAIIKACHRWDPTFPVVEIRKQIPRAVRFGVSKAELLRDVETKGERLRIWTIVDGYQYQPKINGKTRENAPTERPAVLQKPRDKAQQELDLVRIEVDTKLSELTPEEVAALREQLEREAVEGKVPDFSRKLFFETGLRRLVKAKYKIGGA